MPATKRSLLERLQKGNILCAEGYVFELERRGYIKAGAYVPEVVLDNPDVVRQLHREFLRAGSDVLVALTYYAHREKLKAVGRENDLEAMNRQALRIAHEIAAEGDALVAGNICNTWAYDLNNVAESTRQVHAQYAEQVRWAVEEGVDFLLAETIEYVGEALIAVEVAKQFKLPVVLNFAPIYERSKDGYDWIEACRKVKEHGADVVGFNCSRGPRTMLPLLKELRKAVDGPLAAVPVPYRTTKEHPAFQFLKDENDRSVYTLGLDQFLCDRNEMAEFTRQARELGIGFIGICCGAGPHHVRAMAEALGRRVAASKYSPDLSQHSLLGSDDFVKYSEKQFLGQWV
jgi:betaine-homocysteine S-methyltransferase